MSDKTEWVVRPAEAQPAAPSGAVNVVGMPEFDGLLDHIYEHGTTAEGVIERANAFARAVLAQYGPQQPASQPAAPAPCAFRSLLAEARRQYRDSDAAGDVLAWLDERVLDTDYAAPVVTDAMVETVGSALFKYWNDVNEECRGKYRERVRAALEQALKGT